MGDAFSNTRLNTPRNTLEDAVSRLLYNVVASTPEFSSLLGGVPGAAGTGSGPGGDQPPPDNNNPDAGGGGGGPDNQNPDPNNPNYDSPIAPQPIIAGAPPVSGPLTPGGGGLNPQPGVYIQPPAPQGGPAGQPGQPNAPDGLLQRILTQFSLPQYQGAMTAGLRPEQMAALSTSMGGLNSFNATGAGTSGNILSRILQAAGGGAPGGDVLSQFAQGGGPGTNLITSAANPATTSWQTMLQGIAGNGGAPDYATAFSAIDQARQAALGRDTRDIREMFSSQGNRFSSDLANSVAARQAESEKNYLGDISNLVLQTTPSIASAKIAAAQAGGGLNLQDVMRQLQAGSDIAGRAAGAAGTQGNLATSALGLAPGAQSTLSQLPGQVAGQAYGLGEAARGVSDTDLQRQVQEFMRTNSAFFPALMSYAGSAPVISSPGVGSQLLGAGAGVGSALGSAALGAK